MTPQDSMHLQLLIDDTLQSFIPIRQFREEHELPTEFSVSLFEPKNFEGLARVDAAGSQLQSLRQRVLDAIPETITIHQMHSLLDTLRTIFERELAAINPAINLKPSEFDFAVAGFSDANQVFFYEIVRNRSNLKTLNPIQIYSQWMAQSTRVSRTVHPYSHKGADWQIQIVNYVYGRVGLKVMHDDTVTYVADTVYACPVKGYMTTLAHDIMTHILERLD